MLDLTKRRRRKRQDLIDWRRTKVIESNSKGQTQSEIAEALFVGVGTVNRDLSWFRDQARESITKFVEKIQEEHEKSMIGLNAILREAWALSEKAKDSKEKLQALSLAKECYALREELICNAPLIDEALKFGSENINNKTELSKPKVASGDGPNSISEGESQGQGEGEREKDYDIQRSEKKDREGQIRKTTNKTF